MGVYTKHEGIWKKIESMEKTGMQWPNGLYAWGNNNEGQLGQNNTISRSTPV
jgi:alpha-tubulin suppressor-like RCC1 family protein